VCGAGRNAQIRNSSGLLPVDMIHDDDEVPDLVALLHGNPTCSHKPSACELVSSFDVFPASSSHGWLLSCGARVLTVMGWWDRTAGHGGASVAVQVDTAVSITGVCAFALNPGKKAPLRCSDCSWNCCADAADGRDAANGGNPYLAGGVITADEHHYPSILRTIDADANAATEAAAEVHSHVPSHSADSTTPWLWNWSSDQDKGALLRWHAPVVAETCDFRWWGFRTWDAT